MIAWHASGVLKTAHLYDRSKLDLVLLWFEAIEQSSTEMYYLGRGRNPLKVFLYFERNNGNL